MGQSKKSSLKIRQRRIFSEEFKRQKVQQIVEKLVSVKEVAEHSEVSRVTTQLNVSEVAFTVGFSSATYFSKVFKQEFGYAPREFR